MKLGTLCARIAAGMLAATLIACSDDGSGQLRVLLAAEETISHGLQAGAGEENTKDYGVTYSKYMVAIGAVTLARTDPRRSLSSPTVFIADMRQVGEQGQEIVSFDNLKPGQWNQFGFQTPAASASSAIQKLAGVSDADAQEMLDKQLTYWIEGTVDRPDKPVRFVFKVSVPTTFTDCEVNGQPGVSVSEGGSSTATLTLHGDHLWFDSLVRGDESTVARRTDWLVESDLDGDGLVTSDDLAEVPAERVFPSAKGYNLSGGPIAVANALDFVRGQLATQGHLDGEGECETLLPQ